MLYNIQVCRIIVRIHTSLHENSESDYYNFDNLFVKAFSVKPTLLNESMD